MQLIQMLLVLDLSHNHISHLDQVLLRRFTNLQTLVLASNRLTILDYSSLPVLLYVLQAQHNQIQAVVNTRQSVMPKLQVSGRLFLFITVLVRWC